MGITDRRAREKEQRRNDIIDAAERIFFIKGFEEATIDEVAELAELSKGTIYLYFKSKNDLALAINTRGQKKLMLLFRSMLPGCHSGFEKLEGIVRSYIDFFNVYPDYAKLALKFGPFHLDKADQTSMEYAHELENYYSLLFSVFDEGIKDGSINPQVDKKSVISFIWGSILGIMKLQQLGDHEILNRWLDIKAVNNFEYISKMMEQLIKR